MYSRQLETFLQVAQLGSFSKAARALYITPSAVIQQVNRLEQDLGAVLLLRSPHGVALTSAGKLVLEEGLEIVRRSKKLRARLASLPGQDTLVIGTHFLSQPRLFPALWADFWGCQPNILIRSTMLPRILDSWDEVGIIETVGFFRQPIPEAEFLHLCDVPLCLAVAPDHPLAQRESLTESDLLTSPLVTITWEGMHEQLSELYNDLHKRGIQMILVDEYNPALFNTCLVNHYLLQIPACWDALCLGLKTIPCSWPYHLPYGLYVRPQLLPPGAKLFWEDLKAKHQAGTLHLERFFPFLSGQKRQNLPAEDAHV